MSSLQQWAADWRDVWEIVGALGSFAAAAVAVYLAFRAGQDRKTAQAKQQEAEDERDAARAAQHRAELAAERRRIEEQARRCAVTVTASQNAGFKTFTVEFQNRSTMPVHKVRLTLGDTPLKRAQVVGQNVFGSVDPNESVKTRVRLPIEEAPERQEFGWRFIDIDGREWLRHYGGSLKEHPDI